MGKLLRLAGSSGSGGSGPVSYTGLIAANSQRIPNTVNSGGPYVGNARTAHINNSGATTTEIRVGIPNWYVNTSGEAASGSALTISNMTLEYPANTFTPIPLNGGGSSLSIASNTTGYSDLKTGVSIPNGAQYWIRWRHATGTNAVFVDHQILAKPPGTNNPCDTGNGNAWDINNGVDLTSSGTIVPGFVSYQVYPIIILGNTIKPSPAILGDSLPNGANDLFEANGALGYVERWLIASNLPYINLARYGEQASGRLTGSNYTNRMALINTYITHVVCDYGVNDITNGSSAATLQTNLQAFYAAMTKPTVKIQSYLTSETTSTDSWATKGNQTLVSGFALGGIRDTVNGYAAANTLGNTASVNLTAGFIDPADNKILVDGTANKYSDDGTHPVQFGHKAMATSGVAASTLIY